MVPTTLNSGRRRASLLALGIAAFFSFANANASHEVAESSANSAYPYARPYDHFGKPVTQVVTEVVWSGGRLPDDRSDELVFQARLTGDQKEGQRVTCPTIQAYGEKIVAWTESAPDASDGHGLKHPAASLFLRVADTPSVGATVKSGNLTIAEPWARQPPQGSRVAGGYVKLTNTGNAPDRLIAAAAPFAKRVEIHEMAMSDGVMKMRELPKGLEIKPGETLELKPGGYHLMFMEITAAPKGGTRFKGTLTFERAGTVEVEFAVAAPASGGAHKH